MKKFIGKSAAIAAAALLFAQSMPMSKINAANGNNKLTIKSFILGADEYEAAKNHEATGMEADSTNVPDGATARTNLRYDMYKVNSDGTVVMSSVYKTVTSDSSSGIAAIDGIEDGTYWVDPVDPYTNPAFSNADGFFVSFTGSSDIYVYPKFVNNGYDSNSPENSSSEHTVEFVKKGKNPNGSDAALGGVEYKVYFKNMKSNWEAAKDASGAEQIFTTGADGKITIPGLPLGDYYFVEQDSDSTNDNKITVSSIDYLVDQTPQKVTIASGATQKASLSVVNDRALTVKKKIADDGAGDQFNWIIEADIPSNASNLISYNISDVYTDTITNVGITKVLADTIELDIATGNNNNDYSVSDNASDSKLIVSINNFSKLTGKSKIYIYVESEAGTGANLTTLKNNTSIDYKYAYRNPAADDDGDGYCDNVTPAVPLIPGITNPGNSYPADITVNPPGANDSPSAEVTLCTFTISNIENGDPSATELSGAKYKIIKSDGIQFGNELADDSNSIVEVKNLAPGQYQVEQTAVGGAKHKKATSPVVFWVGDDGKIYKDENNAKSTNEFDGNKIVFKNEKTNDNFALPFTGTTATRVFTITGICVMLAAGIFIFIILKKKDEDEEENKG